MQKMSAVCLFRRLSLEVLEQVYGGEGGIRTPGTLSSTADFESAAFNRALPPLRAAADSLLSLLAKDGLSNLGQAADLLIAILNAGLHLDRSI